MPFRGADVMLALSVSVFVRPLSVSPGFSMRHLTRPSCFSFLSLKLSSEHLVFLSQTLVFLGEY